jgi:hypothetical protein
VLQRGGEIRRSGVGGQANSSSPDNEDGQKSKTVSDPYDREHGGTSCGQQRNHAPRHQVPQREVSSASAMFVRQASTQGYAMPPDGEVEPL